jgi:hypothetical protein
MEDFLNHVLRKKYDGWRIFAHFGGRFDVHFVFDWLRAHKPALPLTIHCCGSSVIACMVHDGERRFRFTDSYRLLPKSLETLTNDFDVQHKKLVGRDYTERIYNEHDCRGLYEVLEQFFDAFDVCSETIASHAMRVYRTYYLNREIWQPRRDVEEFCRAAYSGGRCEIFRYDEALLNCYDVNSLYPRAMLDPLPVEYLFETKRMPESENQIGFYHARVRYPECYLPILPWHGDKLYFPVGEFEGVYTNLELERADRDGADIEILRGKLFHAEPVMREYALAMYEMKRNADADGETGKRYIAKILMNSLYGKTGQRRRQRTYCLDDGREGLFPLPNGLAYYETESRANHILPHIAATVTARARLIQQDYLMQGRNWYTDTDSLFTSNEYDTFDTLGSLHLEGRGKFRAYRLKEYFFDGKYKIKGLQRSKDLDREKREAEDLRLAELYLAGEGILQERMAGWAESVRAGLHTVRRIERIRVRGRVRDKRCRTGDDSRPWNVKELSA